VKIRRAKDGTTVVVGARDYRKSHRFCGARAAGLPDGLYIGWQAFGLRKRKTRFS
jgi:hypothetical protein